MKHNLKLNENKTGPSSLLFSWESYRNKGEAATDCHDAPELRKDL